MACGNNALYEAVTERILEALAKGVASWRKPWRASVGTDGGRIWQPRNAISGRVYRGINLLLLGLTEYENPRWLTFNQAKAAGGSVRKGERGTQVLLWKIWEQDREGTISEIPLLRAFYVFNVAQVDGLSLPALDTVSRDNATVTEKIAAAESVIARYTGRPPIRHGGNRACYVPAHDLIQMPLQEQFVSSEAYYATLFHELVHSSGHASRLNRDGVSGRANDLRTLDRYGREELIAEMGAAFLCAEAGIDARLDQSAAYVDNWIAAIQEDRKVIVHAASAAQKAADFVLHGMAGVENSESREGRLENDAVLM